MAEDKTKFQLEANMAKALGPNAFRANIEELKKKAEFGNRQDDTTIVNSDGANASIRLTDNKATIASSQNANMKLNGQQIVAQSYEEKHTTNRLNLEAYEVMVNGHKMNPNIWEYSDMRRFIDSQGGKYDVGCFCMLGTVLTPTWDTQLKRYVLVRRLARMPLFSPTLNVPKILDSLNIDDPTEVAYKYGYKPHTQSVEEYYKTIAQKETKKTDNKKSADADSGNKTDTQDNSENKSDDSKNKDNKTDTQDNSENKSDDSKNKDNKTDTSNIYDTTKMS